MTKHNVEDVFKTTGIPTITYVEPQEYLSLVVAVRAKGKCVVIEGPSGIGKTTAVNKVLSDLKMKDDAVMYSARKDSDFPMIERVANGNFNGIVIIDDFHRLKLEIKEKISNVMKLLADSLDEERKIIVIGINRVGDSLVSFSPDLNNRIATIRFETNPDEKIKELIEKGEAALNIQVDSKKDWIENSQGSFHIAQLMGQKACIQQRVISTCEEKKTIHFSYPSVSAEMAEEFSRSFYNVAREFSTGNRLRREGRAPYLHILKWLSESDTWSLNLVSAMQKHPQQKSGVIQVVEKGYLDAFLDDHPNCSDYIHFDKISKILSVEDPKLMFYLKTINWNNFAKDIGYLQLVSEPDYDFALSFAGNEREIAKKIFSRLQARELAVFYDENEQSDILSEDIEEYLFPIYNSKAAYVIPLLSKHYPNRVWTKFESKAFKERFGKNAVIPVWFDDTDESMFDESKKYGGITFHTNESLDDEVDRIVELLVRKIESYRKNSD